MDTAAYENYYCSIPASTNVVHVCTFLDSQAISFYSFCPPAGEEVGGKYHSQIN